MPYEQQQFANSMLAMLCGFSACLAFGVGAVPHQHIPQFVPTGTRHRTRSHSFQLLPNLVVECCNHLTDKLRHCYASLVWTHIRPFPPLSLSNTGILPPNTLFLMLLAVAAQLVCGIPTLLCAKETPYIRAHSHKAGEHAQHIHSHMHPNPYQDVDGDEREDKQFISMSSLLQKCYLCLLTIFIGYFL